MFIELGKYAPQVKIGLIGASRNCFPRELSQKRAAAVAAELEKLGLASVSPQESFGIIESREDAGKAAEFLKKQNCDAAVLYLGNFSPEIEDAAFVKLFDKPVLLIAAAEESAQSVASARGDALCGLMSASLAITKRGLMQKVTLPKNPLLTAKDAAAEILRFEGVIRVLKGVSNATIGLFGPRPRDFESCNYNAASLLSIGVEIEELGLFDLEDEIARVAANAKTANAQELEISKVEGAQDAALSKRLALYEKALLNLRESKQLSGAATQCWIRQEIFSKHVPCYINSRLTQMGFPIACENDAYSLVAELMCQYASNNAVTMLDINHTIPAEMLNGHKNIAPEDAIGLFHCGNVPAKFMKNPKVCHQIIMARLMEPGTPPDITRGTLEGSISPSPITLFQIHGAGDKLRAYICEGEFLDVDPKTFGSVGVAHVKGFMRFYRNCLLGRFHHHAAVAFSHCGGTLFDALKQLGVTEIYTPQDAPYPSENPFA